MQTSQRKPDVYWQREISRFLDSEESLTEWEYEFVRSNADRDTFSEKQLEVLRRIQHKVDFGD